MNKKANLNYILSELDEIGLSLSVTKTRRWSHKLNYNALIADMEQLVQLANEISAPMLVTWLSRLEVEIKFLKELQYSADVYLEISDILFLIKDILDSFNYFEEI